MLTTDILEKLQEYFELEKSEGSFSDLGLIFQTTVLGFKIAEVERRRALIELSKRYHVNVYSNRDEDLVCFDGINDLCEKAEYYLAHEEERLAIAENGYRKVREHHNYIERINTMLDIIEENENQENDI